MDNETKHLLIKSLERYKTRIQEVEATGWYKDDTVTQNEAARVDRAIADLNKQQQLMACAPELLEAVKLAYRKHHLDDLSIGWNELSEKLLDALCNAMGADGYLEWSEPYGRSQEDE